MPKDGSCFFWSISDQMKLNNVIIEVDELRKKSCAYINNNRPEFENAMTEPINVYLDRMSTKSEWTDEFAIFALCRAYDFTLYVFDINGIHQTVNPGRPTNFKIFYKNRNHFDSIYDLTQLVDKKL